MPFSVSRRTWSALVVLALGLLGTLRPAYAQNATGGAAAAGTPIRLVVPFPPGTALDMVARDIGALVSPALGRPVVVENRSGAGGNLGTEYVVNAAPDGSTLLLTAHNPITINPLIYTKLKHDPLTDLVPIASLTKGGYLLAGGQDLPYRSVADLIAAAKAKPDSITYASYGYGSMAHVCMEQFQLVTGTRMRHIPYRGAIAPDLIAGNVDIAFENLAPSIPLVKDRKLTPLAVTYARVKPLPDIPALSEVVPNFECVSWVGIFAPKGTPEPVQQLLWSELTKAVRSPTYLATSTMLGGVPSPMDQKQFAEFVKADAEKWCKLIPALNIKLD